MTKVVWRTIAEKDLTETYLYIGEDSPEAAERLLDAVEDGIAVLLENPEAGSLREFRSPNAQGIRSWSPRGFPNHLIFYKVNANEIEVIRFLHGARDLPRYLAERPKVSWRSGTTRVIGSSFAWSSS